ncbi:F0F1 ATP synthase subunit B [Lipingzhangella sp. LS1_29]|uniref:ATP synthase subunit b n=1 Tax=Lipingzhangella rawalii TaxID=2055835 RepID=A0ABU2H627_9ACTN|nr:F0F1 ATP synthase subunit B [Lipingzhangella rawalii]MDS1270467.1 F0F1 ATP synthase subunit B [Lipingzhangella rawalii]
MFVELAANEPNILRIDWVKFTFGLLGLFLVYVFVARKAIPKIQKVLDERQDAIEGGIERAKQAEAEAQETLEQYRAQLAEARQEAAQLRERAKEQGAAIVEEMREQANAEARRIVETAQAQIENDRQQAVAELRSEVGELATELATRIVGETLHDSAAQSRVIDRFLDELEQRDQAGVR